MRRSSRSTRSPPSSRAARSRSPAPLELAVDSESPHAARIESAGPTLAAATTEQGASYRFGVTDRHAGRAPSSRTATCCAGSGATSAGLHAVGATAPFVHRIAIDVASYGDASRDFLARAAPRLPTTSVERWQALADRALAVCREAFAIAAPRRIRLHARLATPATCCGPTPAALRRPRRRRHRPAVQDFWMLLSGDRAAMTRQLLDVLDGYESFMDFDWHELRLVEPLRTLRDAPPQRVDRARWGDPTFPINFPWFASPPYWADQCHAHSPSKLDAMADPPLGSPTEQRSGEQQRVHPADSTPRDRRAGRLRRASPGRTGSRRGRRSARSSRGAGPAGARVDLEDRLHP
jgi:hypothetical protein